MSVNSQPPDMARDLKPAPESRAPTWPGSSALLLGWSMWLLAAWLWATWLSYGSLWLGDRGVSLIAAGRFMLAAAIVGMLAVWPMLRLSLALPGTHRRDRRGVALLWMLRDWAGLNLVLAAVTLALAAGTGWGLGQVLALLGLASGWSLLAGLLIAWGATAGGEWPRTLLTAACIFLLAYGNFLPVRQTWALAGPAPAWDVAAAAAVVGRLWAVAAVALGLSVAAVVVMTRRRPAGRCSGL